MPSRTLELAIEARCRSLGWHHRVAIVLATLLVSCDGGDAPPAVERPGAAEEGGSEASGPRPPFGIVLRDDPGAAARRPKAVVFLLVDTLRADVLGCYGSDAGLTPAIDGLAASSVLFRNAIAPSSWTRSSVASIFTSRYPTAAACLTRTDRLSEGCFTLAEVLKTLGGFRCFGVISNANAGEGMGFAQGFDWFRAPELSEYVKYAEDPLGASMIPGEAVNHLVQDVAQELADPENRAKPVFLWLHYVDPHDPYFEHEGLLAVPEPEGRWGGSRLQLDDMDRRQRAHRPVDRDRIRHLYHGEVKHLDRVIGSALLMLNDLFGSLDDVLVILTADHGEGLWDHEERAHGRDLYEEQIHVPLLIHWPGMKAGEGSTIERPVSLVDLAPTILSVCGIEAPATYQGNDLTPLTRGEERGVEHDYIYSELTLDRNDLETIRSRRYKLIRDRSQPLGTPGSEEFYDLIDDPEELRDLLQLEPAELEAHREELDLHRDRLWLWSTTIRASAGTLRSEGADLSSLDEETLRMLRGLGYLGAEELEAVLEKKAENPR